MSDAKRTPYRDGTPVRARTTKPRGALVTRAPHPDDAPREPKLPASTAERFDPDAGVFSGLVGPDPRSTPGEWWAQIALTTLALPLIASTFVCVGWVDLRRAFDRVADVARDPPRPLGIAHPIAWLLGALPIALACFASEAPIDFTVVAVGAPFVALLARRRVRKGIAEREELRAALASERKGS